MLFTQSQQATLWGAGLAWVALIGATAHSGAPTPATAPVSEAKLALDHHGRAVIAARTEDARLILARQVRSDGARWHREEVARETRAPFALGVRPGAYTLLYRDADQKIRQATRTRRGWLHRAAPVDTRGMSVALGFGAQHQPLILHKTLRDGAPLVLTHHARGQWSSAVVPARGYPVQLSIGQARDRRIHGLWRERNALVHTARHGADWHRDTLGDVGTLLTSTLRFCDDARPHVATLDDDGQGHMRLRLRQERHPGDWSEELITWDRFYTNARMACAPGHAPVFALTSAHGAHTISIARKEAQRWRVEVLLRDADLLDLKMDRAGHTHLLYRDARTHALGYRKLAW